MKRLVLATAMPMQMHVHEAWELLNVLRMPDIWTVEAFGRYWDELGADRLHDERSWSHLQQLLTATVQRWGIDDSAVGTLRGDVQPTLDFASFLDVDDVNVIEDSEDTHFDVNRTDEIGGLDDELDELHGFLTDIAQVLEGDGKDTKYRELEDLLRHTILTGQHRICIIFTQHTDTMRWLRQHLANMLDAEAVATYSGEGRQLPDTQGRWQPPTKREVTAFGDAAANPDNPLRILLGTDSMSQGQNLQTCDLLTNYDLPRNFLRLEQRIGRIDRIGGPEIAHVHNLLIVSTVEERVYRGVVDSHSLFGVLIGPTGQVTGDPGVVLGGTEAAITNCVLEGGNVDDVLAELREAAGHARARALTSGTFDHSALDDHYLDDGPWTFDREGLLDRIAAALAPRLPNPSSDGYWTIVTNHHGSHRAVLQSDVALANPDLSLLVCCNPPFDALCQGSDSPSVRHAPVNNTGGTA